MYALNRRQFLRTGAVVAGSLAIGGSEILPALAADGKTLTLYSGQHSHTTAALVDAFTKATGIKVAVRKGGSSELANQIIEEGDASPADVFYSEESAPVVAVAEKGLLAKIPSATLNAVPARFVARDGTWIGASARCRVVAYNTKMVQKEDLAPSVMDYAKPEWKDKVAYVPTSGAFQEQIIAIKLMKGRDAALDWLKGLKTYGRSYNGNMAALRAVERGEVATALINNYYWFALAEELGHKKMNSALDYIGHKDPGALVTVSAIAALKSSKKGDLAQKFLAYTVSAEGQKVIVDSVAEYPVRPDVKSPFALKPWDELDPPAVTPADIGDASDALALEREAGLA